MRQAETNHGQKTVNDRAICQISLEKCSKITTKTPTIIKLIQAKR